MAYDSNNLSALTYANGFTLWHYKTPDLAADVDTTGYFDEAASMLRTGDFIMANTAINSTIASGGQGRVNCADCCRQADAVTSSTMASASAA